MLLNVNENSNRGRICAKRRPKASILLHTLAVLGLLFTVEAAAAAPPPRRVATPASDAARPQPPDWSKLPGNPFFANALTEGLRGPRPVPPESAGTAVSRVEHDSPAATDAGGNQADWSRWISRDTLENEIKAVKLACDVSLRNEGDFKSQGYRDVRRQFSCAATLFAIISQYDQTVRWQKHGVMMSRKLAHAALNAKIGSTPVYREAIAVQQDLSDLIGGAQLPAENGDLAEDWSEIADRQLIMQRLERSVQQDLAAAVASAGEFSGVADEVEHASELTAAFGHVLTRSGMEDGDDSEYVRWCEELKAAAQSMLRAARDQDYDAAREAHGALKNSCVGCHEVYRG